MAGKKLGCDVHEPRTKLQKALLEDPRLEEGLYYAGETGGACTCRAFEAYVDRPIISYHTILILHLPLL